MNYPTNVQDFVDYVDSFYGTNDPLYPMMCNETKQPLTKFDIMRATLNYIDLCMKGDLENAHYTWGDGDSLDRERVRDIMTAIYGTHEIMQPISEEVYSYVRELAHV